MTTQWKASSPTAARVGHKADQPHIVYEIAERFSKGMEWAKDTRWLVPFIIAAMSITATLILGGGGMAKVLLLAVSIEAVATACYLTVIYSWKLWPRERASLMLGIHFLFGLVVLAAYMLEV